MKSVSAIEAALEGFRLARERPRAVVVWALLWLVASLILEVISVRLGGDSLAELMRISADPANPPDPQVMMGIYADLAPMLAISLPVSLVFYAVISAAAYRLVLRREQRPPPVKLGGDEVRQFILMIIIGLVIVGVEVAALTVLFVIAALAMQASQALGAMLLALGVVAVLALVIYVAVRLSLAGPMTLDRGRLSPFGSWALTRGRFWPLFGSYFLAFVLALVVTILGVLVVGGIAALLGGGLTAATAMAIGETASLQELFTPARVVFLAGNAVLSALTFAIISATPALIYRGLTTAEDRATVA